MGDDFVIVNGVLEGYNGTSGHVVIPDGVEKVGKVDWGSGVTNVMIPGSVKGIGEEAFECLDV